MKDRHFFRGVKLSIVEWVEGLLIQSQAVLAVAVNLRDEATEERNQRSPSIRNENIEGTMTNEGTRGRNANITKAGEITRRMTIPGDDRSRDGNARDIEVEVDVLGSIHTNCSAHFNIDS